MFREEFAVIQALSPTWSVFLGMRLLVQTFHLEALVLVGCNILFLTLKAGSRLLRRCFWP